MSKLRNLQSFPQGLWGHVLSKDMVTGFFSPIKWQSQIFDRISLGEKGAWKGATCPLIFLINRKGHWNLLFLFEWAFSQSSRTIGSIWSPLGKKKKKNKTRNRDISSCSRIWTCCSNSCKFELETTTVRFSDMLNMMERFSLRSLDFLEITVNHASLNWMNFIHLESA